MKLIINLTLIILLTISTFTIGIYLGVYNTTKDMINGYIAPAKNSKIREITSNLKLYCNLLPKNNYISLNMTIYDNIDGFSAVILRNKDIRQDFEKYDKKNTYIDIERTIKCNDLEDSDKRIQCNNTLLYFIKPIYIKKDIFYILKDIFKLNKEQKILTSELVINKNSLDLRSKELSNIIFNKKFSLNKNYQIAKIFAHNINNNYGLLIFIDENDIQYTRCNFTETIDDILINLYHTHGSWIYTKKSNK